jgi:hypothetical protein
MMTFLKKIFQKNTKPQPPKIELIANDIDEVWNIRIVDGDFAGVVFTFNRVQFIEEDAGLRISYGFDIIDSSIHSELALTSPQFKVTIHSILEQVLTEG